MTRHRADGPRVGRRRRSLAALLGIGMTTALAVGGCAGGSGSGVADAGRAELIAAGAGFTPIECGTYSGTGCAPQRRRIDLAEPTFSNPTRITNPLFPISELGSAVLLGRAEGAPSGPRRPCFPRPGPSRGEGRGSRRWPPNTTAYRNGRIAGGRPRPLRAGRRRLGLVPRRGRHQLQGRRRGHDRGHLARRGEGPARDDHAGRSRGRRRLPAREHPRDRLRGGDGQGGRRHRAQRRAARWPAPSIAEELDLAESTSQKTFAPGYGEFSTGKGRDLERLSVAVSADALPAPPAPHSSRASRPARPACSDRSGRGLGGGVGHSAANEGRLGRLRRQGPPPMIASRTSGSLDALARAVKARKGSSRQPGIRQRGAVDPRPEAAPSAAGRDRPRRFELWASRSSSTPPAATPG